MAKLLFVTSEVSPLIKTGGLADVSGSLPVALKALRWSVRLLMPAYPAAVEKAGPTKLIARLQVPGVMGKVQLLEGRLPGTRLPVWLVDYAPAFARDGNPYLGPDGHNWPDNAERFALLARAAVEIAQGRAGLSWVPDVVHCNDWQTGLVPALLSLEPQRPATVFTIHNLAYQGLFPQSSFHALGLPPQLWSHEGLEFHDQLSFIKGGLAYADHVTTVSPSYAEEILSPEFGYGLEGLLQHRSKVLTGIINGIDQNVWNPGADPHLPQNYSAKSFRQKVLNKRALQSEFALPQEDDKLLLGSIGRLVEQKGIDLILAALGRLTSLPVQLVLLGSGDKYFEQELAAAAQRHPDRLAIRIGYNEALAHRIEAGADAFLMPSRFEPCGLNQLYSLRYGTPPIVHAVGGLKDTVADATPATLRAGTATGFCFDAASTENLLATVERAVKVFARPRQWPRLAKTGMAQDFSWQTSARRYAQLYRSLLTAKHGSKKAKRE
jgi:starch synthase